MQKGCPLSLYDLAATLGFALQGLGLALFGSGLRREPLHLFRGLRISHYPFQSFFPAAENRQLAPGKGFHAFVELARKALSPYQGRFLYIWLIEYGGFFHRDEGIPVKRGSSKIRKYQGRAEWLSGDVIGNSAGNFFNFTSRAMG